MADAGTQPGVPLTRVTAVGPTRFEEPEEAERWLRAIKRERDRATSELSPAIALVNRVVHAQRTAARDPYLPDVHVGRALAVRLGFGTGDEIADSRWSSAVELPPEHPGRRVRVDEVGPHERLAAMLAEREESHPAEAMILRARADLEAGRPREAALQLDAARAALAGTPAAPSEDELRAALREADRAVRDRRSR